MTYQFSVGVDNDGVGSLARRHVVRGLLQLDHLFVAELRTIVDHGEGMVGVTMSAESWLSDTASFNLNGGLQVADGATEESRVDLGDEVRRANDHTSDGDQLINI